MSKVRNNCSNVSSFQWVPSYSRTTFHRTLAAVMTQVKHRLSPHILLLLNSLIICSSKQLLGSHRVASSVLGTGEIGVNEAGSEVSILEGNWH